jgi:hypothetical protein
MDDVCGCARVMSFLMSCHVMTKEDIMVCKMIGKIGENRWFRYTQGQESLSPPIFQPQSLDFRSFS